LRYRFSLSARTGSASRRAVVRPRPLGARPTRCVVRTLSGFGSTMHGAAARKAAWTL